MSANDVLKTIYIAQLSTFWEKVGMYQQQRHIWNIMIHPNTQSINDETSANCHSSNTTFRTYFQQGRRINCFSQIHNEG